MRWMWLRRLVFAAVIVGAIYVALRFAEHNASSVTVGYIVGEVESVSLWLALAASFGAGFLLASLISSYQLVRSGLTARRYRKAVSGLESEVHHLRNLPLSPDEGLPTEKQGPGVRNDAPKAGR